jgi:hypothetical protein
MGWAGRVACMGAVRNAYNFVVTRPERKRSSEDLSIDVK